MSTLIISSKVPENYSWLDRGEISGNDRFKEICRKVKKGLTENISRAGWDDEKSKIPNFAILLTTQDRINRLNQLNLINSNNASLLETFSYKMDGNNLYSEQNVVVVETFQPNSEYTDYIKWRARNIFAKLIDNAGHPNGFGLELNLYEYYNGTIFPQNSSELYCIMGNPEMKTKYLMHLHNLKRQRVIIR